MVHQSAAPTDVQATAGRHLRNVAQATCTHLSSFHLCLVLSCCAMLCCVALCCAVQAITMGMMLAAEPAEPDIMDRPPRRPGKRLLGKLILWRCAFVSGLLVILVLGMYGELMSRLSWTLGCFFMQWTSTWVALHTSSISCPLLQAAVVLPVCQVFMQARGGSMCDWPLFGCVLTRPVR